MRWANTCSRTLWASEYICQRCTICLTYFAFFFLINVAFRVRCNVPHREDDFLFHGSNRKNFIKIPLTNLDRGKNPSMFWVSLVSRRLPIFSWQTLQWKWLHSEVHHQISICTWCALNTVSSCFLFLFSPFSLRLSPNWFLFRNFSSLFFFFWASLRRNFMLFQHFEYCAFSWFCCLYRH